MDRNFARLKMIVVSKFMVPKGYIGLTIYPFVFIKEHNLKDNQRFLNHELIHLRQQLELMIIPFFIWYIIEFIFRYFQYGNWKLAYRNISFEREAYFKENDLTYLKNRGFWRFMKYIYFKT